MTEALLGNAGIHLRNLIPRVLALLLSGLPLPVSAQLLPVNSCVLTLSKSGSLVSAMDGTSLSSDAVGGSQAVLIVAALGLSPAIHVGAPSLSGPGASTSGAITTITYRSLAGANQTPTSAASGYRLNGLADTIQFDSKATNNRGFVAGTYSITAPVTCEQ